MKLKYFTLIALFLSYFSASSQNGEELISLSKSEKTVVDVLFEIEQKLGYKFYYSEDWLNTDKRNFDYSNVTVNFILNDVFKDSSINFFIASDKRIILTNNSLIYDELPNDFFPKDSTSFDKTTLITDDFSSPVLLKKNEEENKFIETVLIGKDKKDSKKNQFTLSGFVTDAKTGSPISDLAITVSSKNIGTVTNENGYYEIKLQAGLNLIETSLLGFEKIKKRVILYNDGRLNLSLNNSFEQLNEIVIQSEGFKNIEDSSTGNSRIGSDDSKNIPLVLGERDVLKVATMLPGVTTAGEGSSGFNVRGGKTDQNLILLDKAVIYNPSHFFGIFQALNPFTIKDVNIYKGSIPAEFGGRISSVFDISVKDANDKKFGADISVGPVTANVVVETPIIKEKSSLLIGSRAAYSDWILKSLKTDNFKNTQASFYDLIGKYTHKINEKNEIRAMAYYSNDVFSITSDSIYSYNNRLFSLKWNHEFNEKNSGIVTLTNSQYKFNIGYDDIDNDNFNQGFQIEESQLKFKMNYNYNKSHTISYGLSGKLYIVYPGEIKPNGPNNLITPLKIPKEKALESAIFVSDKYEFNDKLLLDLGLRYSLYAALGPATKRRYLSDQPKSELTVVDTMYYKNNEVIKTYGGPELRFSARYLLSSDLSIKVSYNNTYQFIHTLSNNTTVSPIDTWKLSDNNVKPQQANQVSLGIYKNFNINAYELSLEGFYKKQKNIIDFKTGAKLLLNKNIETEVLQGDGKVYGVEFLLKKNKGDLSGWLGYTYSRTFFKLDSDFPEESVNDGKYYPANFDKPHDVSLVLNYKFTQRISLSSNFVYQTGRPVTFPTGNYQFNNAEYVLYSDRNQFRIPDYYRLDLGFNFEGNHKKNKLAHSFWSLSIYNVLSRNNPYSVFFVNNNGEIKALQSSIFNVPVPSITYNISF
ncbi:MAG: TonB-dependent receptor [Flavobacteriaceae bacterium]|nr:TonB-dependent receptor [Flavobacteriaceae bacterium]